MTGKGSALRWADRMAIGASTVCMVHCLALPLAFALLPTLATVVPIPESFHVYMVLLALPVSGFALLTGQRLHRSVLPPAMGVAGLALMIAGLFAPEGAYETALTVLGSSGLAAAHVVNLRCRRGCRLEA